MEPNAVLFMISVGTLIVAGVFFVLGSLTLLISRKNLQNSEKLSGYADALFEIVLEYLLEDDGTDPFDPFFGPVGGVAYTGTFDDMLVAIGFGGLRGPIFSIDEAFEYHKDMQSDLANPDLPRQTFDNNITAVINPEHGRMVLSEVDPDGGAMYIFASELQDAAGVHDLRMALVEGMGKTIGIPTISAATFDDLLAFAWQHFAPPRDEPTEESSENEEGPVEGTERHD